MKREPAVAGYFYSNNPQELKFHLSTLVVFRENRIKAKGVIVPHAGYMYSGWVAGKVYGSIVPPEIAIIIGPNHTGLGERASVFNGDSFITPLGEVLVEKELVEALVKEVPFLSKDVMAHLHEHSIEVQVPFLQYINPQIKIIPICLSEMNLEENMSLGKGIAEVVKKHPDKDILIVGSSDFSHYVPHETAKEKDMMAIKKILELSEEDFFKLVLEERLSICGYNPIAVTISACKNLGAEKAELIEYMTSGDVIKDYSSVVGYAGIIIY
ncbi:MAG: AmmeMemoRadiSam system protein B [Thermodesulfobacterium sp.]|nr:AmmeMemoRadiSam system protein B [Thermodesulfobacterium sp.]